VIETKHYEGWIFGEEDQKNWKIGDGSHVSSCSCDFKEAIWSEILLLGYPFSKFSS